ncbi:MAG TPA: hypothetical protein VJ870_04955 [Amycolatopsis sp.]|nr:hypothetical protein [Amycolatopsis sp.]
MDDRPPTAADEPAAQREDRRLERGSFTLGRADLADHLLRAAGEDGLIRTAVSVAAGR